MSKIESEAVGSEGNDESSTAPELLKTNPYDAMTVKHLFDDSVAEIVKETRKFSEDHSYSNRKLFVGAVACALAITSHFAPVPYPYAPAVLFENPRQ